MEAFRTTTSSIDITQRHRIFPARVQRRKQQDRVLSLYAEDDSITITLYHNSVNAKA